VTNLLYLDTSAIVKLVIAERESATLADEVARWPHLVSSTLAEIELRRVVARAAGLGDGPRENMERVLATISFLPMSERVTSSASSVTPAGLRTLGAIHLATVLLVADEIGAVAVYDQRLADAVSAQGLTVIGATPTPGGGP
jgi:uncharacterized protein